MIRVNLRKNEWRGHRGKYKCFKKFCCEGKQRDDMITGRRWRSQESLDTLFQFFG